MISYPFNWSFLHASNTHLCSIELVIIWFLSCNFLDRLANSDNPIIAKLLDSVAPDVKIISLFSPLINLDMLFLAFSIYSHSSLPGLCVLECGLANCDVIWGNMASNTLGSSCDVAATSK